MENKEVNKPETPKTATPKVEAPKIEEKKPKVRRKGKSMLHIPESKKRTEPTRKDGSIYVVEAGERKLFHIELENPLFDSKTGKKLSTPHIVKLDGIKEYRQFIINVHKSGYQFDMIHDPRRYLAMTPKEIKAQDASFLSQAKEENKKK